MSKLVKDTPSSPTNYNVIPSTLHKKITKFFVIVKTI